MTANTSTFSERRDTRALVDLLLLVLAWSLVCWACWRIFDAPTTAQWDLRVYRQAAERFRVGADPYASTGGLPFVYPPIVLPALALFVRLSEFCQYWCWLGAKLGCLVVLLRTAKRHFEPFHHDYASVFFLLLAFNGTIFVDVLAGNVALFEQALIWSAVALLLRGHHGAFVLVIALTSQLKVTPALLMVLVLLLPPRPQWRWFMLGVAGVLTTFALQWLIWPALFRGFLQRAGSLDESGHLAPSTYAVVSELANALGSMDPLWVGMRPWLYMAAIVGVCALVARTWRTASLWLRANPTWLVALTLTSYALVLPRFKNYAYVLLVIPAWMVIRRIKLREGPWLALLVLLPAPKTFLPTGVLADRAIEYTSWVAAVVLFLVITRHVAEQSHLALDLDPPSPAPSRESLPTV